MLIYSTLYNYDVESVCVEVEAQQHSSFIIKLQFFYFGYKCNCCSCSSEYYSIDPGIVILLYFRVPAKLQFLYIQAILVPSHGLTNLNTYLLSV